MPTLAEQIAAQDNKIASLRAQLFGLSDSGVLYAIAGDSAVYGSLITEGFSSTDMYLCMDGQDAGDTDHLNPNINTPAIRISEYPNQCLVDGKIFLSENINKSVIESDNLLLANAPGTAGFGRNDVVYVYVNQNGSTVAIEQGTASTACKTDFDTNGLDESVYPSTYDPTIPTGAMPIARVYVQYGDTGIANARIADLRDFSSRLQGAEGMVWKGAWSGATNYSLDDAVSYGGETFISLQNNNLGNTPPTGTSNAFWDLVARQGVGGGLSFSYNWSTDTAATDPGAGIIKANNADLSTATILRVDDLDSYGNDIQSILGVIDNSGSTVKSYITLTEVADHSQFIIFAVTGLTEQTGYFDINIVYAGGSTTSIADTLPITFSFTRTGDRGGFGGASFAQLWNTDTGATDPGGGRIKANNADLSSATVIRVDDLDGYGNDIQAFMRSTDNSSSSVKGQIIITELITHNKYVIYNITSVTEQTGYFDIAVTYVDGSITSIVNGLAVGVSYTRTGDKGDQGIQGIQGEFAGVAVNYLWSINTTDSDPGSTYMKANNAALSSVTELYLDDEDASATDIQAFLRTLDDSTSPVKGYIRISKELDATAYAIYTISAATENTGYFKLTVVHVNSSVSSFSTDDSLLFSFSRTGNAGAGTGDVVGPASATNNNLCQYDGTTGKLIKDGPALGSGGNNVPQLNSNGRLPNGVTVENPWETKAGAFTAVEGHNYFDDVTASHNITLPGSPTTNGTMLFSIVGATATNVVTVLRNTNTIEGQAEDMTITNDCVFGVKYNGTTYKVFYV